MVTNNSPWIKQLNRIRPVITMHEDVQTDVAIVGGGIAGVSTAFFVLKNTDKKVILLEGNKVAHGATGHNAGQVTSYFERPFNELVKEFGLTQAAKGQRDIELAWELLDEMYTEAKLDIPFSRFTGFDGYSTFDQIMNHLKNNALRQTAGMPIQMLYLSEKCDFAHDIPEEFEGLYSLVPHKEVLSRLETNKHKFLAVAEQRKGVINSALFTEEVASYLLEAYKDRFTIFESTRVNKVVLKEDHAVLDAEKFCVDTKRVVLCTNGFENFEIFNTSGLEIDTKFHHIIDGVVARMSGYLEEMNKPPMAISYYMNSQLGFDDMEDPYFYLTRRMYEHDNNKHNLVCLGGPQNSIPDREEYLFDFDYPDEVEKKVGEFARSLYDTEKKIEYIFSWHGLMGYTPNRVRRIGPEPINPVLLYNLGCNGVGILPSVFGGKRISRFLSGEDVEVSIFDPKNKLEINEETARLQSRAI
ncbi:MAG: NAD(P)/FAD-dependent oxidoreductase [Minisyncoccota bacterium]